MTFRRLLFLLPAALSAGELKIDINREEKNREIQTETGYTMWSGGQYDGGTTASGTAGITRSFTTLNGENVTVTFSQTAASAAAGGTGIKGIYYKTGAEGDTPLISDGLTVDPPDFSAGGQIQMSLTGLSAGSHTLLTYHNAADNLAAGSLGPIDVHVNGSLAIDDLEQSIRAASTVESALSYIEFTVSGPDDTATILFAADPTAGGPAVTIRNPMINGFEIDTPHLHRAAGHPSPANADGHVDAESGSVTLSWTAALAGDTVSRDIYFGTDSQSVLNATPASPSFLGNQTTTSRVVPVTDPHATYYWRVDEIHADGETTKGTVWSFRPRTLAFPGAEGYGRFARGGRGGQVVAVTSLEDYGSGDPPIPGTLRHAIEEVTGPRTIVFDVAGLITLQRRLTLSDNQVTLAGQTAPGKGICLRGYALGLSGSDDTIVRFIRNRPGDISGATIDGGGLAGCDHSIMDHCSISWSIDEAFSGRSAKHITLQKTLISEALNIAGHQNYPPGTEHGYAATISGGIGSYHHNLLAHCEGRNWSLGGGLDGNGEYAGQLDIRNNVVYNWGNRTTDGGAHEVNFVNNYYKPGPASTIFTALNAQYDNFPGTQQYYMAGNVMPGHFGTADQAAGRTTGGYVPTTYPVWVSTPFFDAHVTTHSAEESLRVVLSDVGCSLPLPDDHDLRVIGETRTGTFTYTGQGPYGGSPGLPNSQDDVGGWEDYPAESRPAAWDSDRDGMPDWWEVLHGTDPDSPVGDFSEANADPENDGFTRLEDYLNWMAGPHGHTPVDTPLLIDPAPFALGFSSPSFSIGSVGNDSATLTGDDVIEFTPASGFAGLAEIVLHISGEGVTTSRTLHVSVQNHPHLLERRWRGGANDNTWDATTPNWINGSLLCAWQDGGIAIFDSIGEKHPEVTVNAEISTHGLVFRGPRFRISGEGMISSAHGVETHGNVFISGGLGLSVSGSWINHGDLDLLTHTGDLSASITHQGSATLTPSSALRIGSTERSGSFVHVFMLLPEGHTFTLQKSTSLSASDWTDVPGQTRSGTGAVESFTDTDSAGKSAFYRIRAEP